MMEAAATPDPRPRGTSTRTRVIAVEAGARRSRRDALATEEPMEIRVEGPSTPQRAIAVTMRTPGHDFELAAGFLATEGLIHRREDVASVRYCAVPAPEQNYNVVTVALTRPFDASSIERHFYANSSCGICGKASLDAVEVLCAPLTDGPVVAESTVLALPERLRASQRVFERTGGLHACGLFAASGDLLTAREDVGRHNALDKLVGQALLAGSLPLSEAVLMVSGRVSFEIVQKAAVAGVPIICAVSAPTSLAVDAARRMGMTVVGFLRGDRFNVYTHPERIAAD